MNKPSCTFLLLSKRSSSVSVSVSLLTVQLVGPGHVTGPGRKCVCQRFRPLSPAFKDNCTTHPRVWQITLQGYKRNYGWRVHRNSRFDNSQLIWASVSLNANSRWIVYKVKVQCSRLQNINLFWRCCTAIFMFFIQHHQTTHTRGQPFLITFKLIFQRVNKNCPGEKEKHQAVQIHLIHLIIVLQIN